MKNPILAGVLSAVVPGLGQFYCRQWGKGAGFLVGTLLLFGFLMASVDPAKLQQAAETGAPLDNMGQIISILLLLLALAILSIVDAVRTAKRSSI
jgi:prolipoprotein diacylglyceryltransferase